MRNEECHLQERPLDWPQASDEELLDCLKGRPLDPRLFAYIQNQRPHVLRQSLLEHEKRGGWLGPAALKFLGRRR